MEDKYNQRRALPTHGNLFHHTGNIIQGKSAQGGVSTFIGEPLR